MKCLCGRQLVAMDAALALQLAVQCGGREPATFAPLLLQSWWCRGGCARPGADGSWEPMRDTQTEGKIKGRGTSLRGKPVCTWGGRGTHRVTAPCRAARQCLVGIGESACFARRSAMTLDGGTA